MEEEFVRLFEAEFDYVHNSLRRLGVRDADLDDEVHQVFLRIHQRMDRRDPARPARPWLFAFAVRVAADYRRGAQHRREIPGLPAVIRDPSPLADEVLAREQVRALVCEALQDLEPDKREIFIAVEIDEQSGPEVAEALGIPLNTAYSRLRLARDEFAAALKRAQGKRGGPR
jgi:RNA polymerase sigma-70 factor (ECF subfamily)